MGAPGGGGGGGGQSLRAWTVFGHMGLQGVGTVLQQLNTFNTAGRMASATLTGLGGAAGIAAAGVAAVGIGVAAWTIDGIKNFALFDDKMTQSLAIMGDVSDVMRNDMELAAREVGRSTRFGADQAAEAFYFLASAGMEAEQAIEALPVVAAFATAGNFQLEQATSLLADAQASLGLSSKNAAVNMENMTRVSDTLIAANILANASTEEFSRALTTKSAARMRQFGVEVEEGVAVLAAYAQQGAKGQLAGERFSIVLRDLTRMAVTNSQAFKENNIQVYEEGTGALRNIADIVVDFEKRLAGLSSEQQAQVFAQLNMNEQLADGITSLIGMSGEIKRYETEMRAMKGVTQEVADKQLLSLSAKWDLVKSKITDVDYAMGTFLRGSLHGLLDGLNSMADGLNSVVGKLEEWGSAAGDAIEKLREAQKERQRLVEEEGAGQYRPRSARSGGLRFESSSEMLLRAARERREEQEKLNESIKGTVNALEEERAAQVKASVESAQAVNVMAAVEAEERRKREAWARELPRLEAEVGMRGPQARIEALRQELAELDEYSEAWKSKYAEILRAQVQYNQQMQREEERLQKEREQYAQALLEYQLSIGEITVLERLAQIDRELAAVKRGTEQELELRAEQYKLLQEQKALADEWVQYQIQTGEVTKETRIRQIQEQVDAIIAEHGRGTQAELELLQERNAFSGQLTSDMISQAKKIADKNKEAALASLRAWQEHLQAMGVLTPALEAEIGGAMEEIKNNVKEKTNELHEELKRAGENMGRDLIRGILSGSRDLGDMLEDALISILSTVIWRVGSKALGIASPSKETMYWGEMLVQGIVVGYQQQATVAERQLSAINQHLLAVTAPAQEQVLGMANRMNVAMGAGSLPALNNVGAGMSQDGGFPGLSAGLKLNIPVERLPPRRTPFDQARDADWLDIFNESIVTWESKGGRLRGSPGGRG